MVSRTSQDIDVSSFVARSVCFANLEIKQQMVSRTSQDIEVSSFMARSVCFANLEIKQQMAMYIILYVIGSILKCIYISTGIWLRSLEIADDTLAPSCYILTLKQLGIYKMQYLTDRTVYTQPSKKQIVEHLLESMVIRYIIWIYINYMNHN